MNSQPDDHEASSLAVDDLKSDPLIAALPPNTDYITYLTLLEYQLTPERLPTLNKLLQQDDGSLAAGIGWDLLKLVLPMLRVNPTIARECLDIIARRGNPREVIVRVSEELENLGHEQNDVDDGDTKAHGDAQVSHEFTGEAPPIHLGEMTLDGMPGPKQSVIDAVQADDEQTPDFSEQDLTLQALLSMLAILHPRIKAKYPSRFLATTLPAALGAYRRLSMDSDSTLAFVQVLTRLGGKERPALPPRVSTSDVLVSKLRSTGIDSSIVSAPLPDPESSKEANPHEQKIVDAESAINQRLLQAVLLEIVDERTTASGEEQPPLTARLRARRSPGSMTSARRTELEAITDNEAAHIADKVLAKFVTATKTLNLDPVIELTEFKDATAANSDDEEVGDYPTKPSHIPLSATGLLLLYSALRYVEGMSGTKVTTVNQHVDWMLQTVNRQYSEDSRLHNSAPAIDLVLALLYTLFCTGGVDDESSSSTQLLGDQALLQETFATLRDIFTTCPDLDLRDNAFFVATTMFHSHCSYDTKIKLLQDILGTQTVTNMSPLHDAQGGNLKSIAIDWLKDELFPQSSKAVNDRLTYAAVEQLSHLLFQASDIPAIPNAATETTDAVDQFAIYLPYYISSLNLLSLLAHADSDAPSATSTTAADRQPETPLPDQTSSHATPPPTGGNIDLILAKSEAMLGKLENWKSFLSGQLVNAASTTDADGLGSDISGVPIRDVFALEDAIGRVREIIPHDDD